MNVTEKEAGAKTCPVSRGATIDPTHPYMGTRPCVASVCMAWRWVPGAMKEVAPPEDCPECFGKGRLDDTREEGIETRTCERCDGDGKIGHFEHVGYCGLAGPPGLK